MSVAIEARLIHGTGARMSDLADGSVQLVMTGPPYFPDALESALREGIGPEADLESLRQAIQTFAWSLRPVFAECHRVLMPGGRIVVQTRDVRLRHLLVPVEGIHRHLLESIGFTLYTRHLWRPRFTTIARRRVATTMSAGIGPAPFDPEVFLVFWKPGDVRIGELALRKETEAGPGGDVEADKADLALLQQDICTTQPGVLFQGHRFQAPVPLLRALIRAHSRPADRVVDPFAGGATSLVVARALGREAWGYEVDATSYELARANLALPLKGQS
jgi:DNA modification methylase